VLPLRESLHEKPTILRNSKTGYQLREGDVDLQGTARNPLETIEVAKETALEKLPVLS
jgi:hypothetical protein